MSEQFFLWESLVSECRYILRCGEDGKITGVSEWKEKGKPEDPASLEFSEAPSLLKYCQHKAGLQTRLE